VQNSEGPWLLYDNEVDPYQMHNRINDPAAAGIQTQLDRELERQLRKNGDSLTTAREALAKWGYTVNAGGEIPYYGEFICQSPGPDGGERCCFKP
jgi:hypothetical protein